MEETILRERNSSAFGRVLRDEPRPASVPPSMSDLTRILDRAREGDAAAAGELYPLVYDELRSLAARKMAGEGSGNTLQPTALVHEAWLRLGADAQPAWQNRAHFFGAAAEAMRRILVENARRRGRQKRGGGLEHQPLEETGFQVPAEPANDELLAVHEVLDRLATEEPGAADVVKLRYFVGLPLPEVAEVLHMSPRTASRLWAYARVRLKEMIQSEGS